MNRRNGVDIIIPVYNALDDLKICLDSIRKHTDLSLDRVIMIDDQSPDPNVYPYMRSAAEDGIVVLQNEENQGFSGTINRGLLYSDRDVILLNSDTVVTENWVDKMVACAYSDRAIGTVTPFSNNATLCSIPNFCQENVVPYGLSIDEYARIIERSSLKKYPRITVAVGFCMYIKQEVIDAVGLFDKETFQRGYGEENDYCWRTEQLGYYHVLCDDTYIYHSGSASFVSEEKRQLMEDHQRILLERYPRQFQENGEYVRDNPHQFLRTNVDLYARTKNGKKNLLYLLHLDFRPDTSNSFGGTQFHVKDLMNRLRREYNVFVVARDNRWLRVTVYLEEEQISLRFPIGREPDFQQFHNEKIEGILRDVILGFEIDLVHVHHVSGISFDIFHIAHELGLPLTLTLHDYYYICPTVKLLEKGTAYCGGSCVDCASCLNSQLGYARQVDYLPVWRKACREALELCDVLVAPSEAAKEVYAGVYPEVASRIRVIPHGMDLFVTEPSGFREATSGCTWALERVFQEDYTVSGWAYQQDRDSSLMEVFLLIEDREGNRGQYRGIPCSRSDVSEAKGSDLYRNCGFTVPVPDGYFATGDLKIQIILRDGADEFCSDVLTVSGYEKKESRKKRVAFLGGLSEAKGSHLAYQMISQSGSKYDWYLIGGLGDPNLVTLTAKNVRKIGWYTREDVTVLLRQNRIDLVCILPIWPETFCYTVSEAELAGVPVLVTDMGALGERIRRDQTGWIISAESSAKDALDMLDRIFADEEGMSAVRKNLDAFCHRSIEQMCGEYSDLYRDFGSREKTSGTFDAQRLYHGFVMGRGDGSGESSDVDLLRQINELEATLHNINQSLEYRMVKFFNRENMPFKKQIKWLIGVAYRVYRKIRYKR